MVCGLFDYGIDVRHHRISRFEFLLDQEQPYDRIILHDYVFYFFLLAYQDHLCFHSCIFYFVLSFWLIAFLTIQLDKVEAYDKVIQSLLSFQSSVDVLLCTVLAYLLIQSYLYVAPLNPFTWKQPLIIKVLVMPMLMHPFFFLLPTIAADFMLFSFYLAVFLMFKLIIIELKLFSCLMSNKRIDKNFSNHNLSIFVCCSISWLSLCFLFLLFLITGRCLLEWFADQPLEWLLYSFTTQFIDSRAQYCYRYIDHSQIRHVL